MKIFRFEDLLNIKKQDPLAKTYRPEVLTKENGAMSLGGMFGLLEPNSEVPYHFHKDRESVIIIIEGEAVEIVEGEKFHLKTGDILFISAKERHSIKNLSTKTLRFIEFFTNPPLGADFFDAEEGHTK
ncbi:MAG: cupin domain-containing protein [Sphaerochaetaceae bacterium]